MKKFLYGLTKKPFNIKLPYFYYFHRLWRKKNRHNRIQISRDSHVFPGNRFEDLFDVVSVGNGSYGEIIVYHYGEENAGLKIGNLVSVGKNVYFLLGGNHFSSGLFNYPFRFFLNTGGNDSYSKGPITIEDDVWIGMNSMILSGVRIGKGAVIAAGSVITRDVEPFSIMAGNPAKKVKDRFDRETAEKLLNVDYSGISADFIKKNIERIYNGDKRVIDDLAAKIGGRH